jgi:hypothetical protein
MAIVNCLQRSYTPAVDVPEELYFKKNQDGCQDPYLTKCYVSEFFSVSSANTTIQPALGITILSFS